MMDNMNIHDNIICNIRAHKMIIKLYNTIQIYSSNMSITYITNTYFVSKKDINIHICITIN